jgi:hypothetical protein
LMKQLLWRYSILQFNNRREFDLRRGDFSEVALDLALTTHAVNLDYKKSLHDWNIKTESMHPFRIICKSSYRIRPLFPILTGRIWDLRDSSYDLSITFR